MTARRAPFLVVLLAAAALAAACGGGEAPAPQDDAALVPAQRVRSGEPRAFAMGFAAIPAALSRDAYLDTLDTAAEHADFVMIQRAIPWDGLGEDGRLSDDAIASMEAEAALVAERGLDVLFAIDPWEPTNRARLAGDAPGEGFNSAEVVDGYHAFAQAVLQVYAPRWLALAVDVDQFAAARPDQLEAFQSAYIEAYRLVKRAAPDTLVFLTFQLEDLQSLIPWGQPHDPQWGLILRFAAFLDLLAVSTFPSFIFPFQADIPDAYFSRLLAFDRPIAIVPAGYASEPGRGGVTFGTSGGQRAFVERLLREAERSDWELIVWLTPQDPAFASASPFDLVSRMGLRTAKGEPKPAWEAWANVAGRPWQPTQRQVRAPFTP